MINQKLREISKYRTEVENNFSNFFEQARKVDEAEFYTSLLKHANLSPRDSRDTLKNFEQLFNFLPEIIISKKISAENILRTFLLVYCHFFEWSEMFNLFYDLVKISKGGRSGNIINGQDKNRGIYWEQLSKLVKGELTEDKIKNVKGLISKMSNGSISVNKKIKIIKQGTPEIGKLLANLFDSRLRNGFVHNSYSFTSSGINIYDEIRKVNINYSWDEINSIVNNTKSLTLSLLEIWRKYLGHLKNRHLKGKYCEYEIVYGTDKKFKINLISGSLPLGFYP